MFNHIVCRYNEIATKSGNRAMFERRLINNMRAACSDLGLDLRFSRMRGRIVIYRADDNDFSAEEEQAISERLVRCFGLDSFSFCLEGGRSMEAVEEMVRKTVSRTRPSPARGTMLRFTSTAPSTVRARMVTSAQACVGCW